MGVKGAVRTRKTTRTFEKRLQGSHKKTSVSTYLPKCPIDLLLLLSFLCPLMTANVFRGLGWALRAVTIEENVCCIQRSRSRLACESRTKEGDVRMASGQRQTPNCCGDIFSNHAYAWQAHHHVPPLGDTFLIVPFPSHPSKLKSTNCAHTHTQQCARGTAVHAHAALYGSQHAAGAVSVDTGKGHAARSLSHHVGGREIRVEPVHPRHHEQLQQEQQFRRGVGYNSGHQGGRRQRKQGFTLALSVKRVSETRSGISTISRVKTAGQNTHFTTLLRKQARAYGGQTDVLKHSRA